MSNSTGSCLAGKVVVVTGATSGIGEAMARAFGEARASLILGGRNADAGNALVQELEGLGGEAQFVAGDLGDPSAPEALVQAARLKHGRIDVLALNAGWTTGRDEPFWEVPDADFDRVYGINVRAAWLCAKHAVALMPTGGSIILTASVTGIITAAGDAIYGSSKAALLHLARGMAADLGPRGVRVNTVSPGVTATPMLDAYLDDADDRAAALKELEDAVPLGRAGRPSEVAQAAVFLASADASYCTGANLVVDGGYRLG